MREQLQMVISGLKTLGYVEAAQVVWGSTTSDVPFNWEKGGEASVDEGSALPAGQLASFQVRLALLPADLHYLRMCMSLTTS